MSRASFRSIRQSATCAGVTVIPSTSDHRAAMCAKQRLRRPVDALAVLDDAGGVLQQHGAVHRPPPMPCAIAQCSSASASASLSSAGAKPSRRTASITACLSALPLPVTCRLIVPTGHALVRDAVRLGPGGEMREVSSVGVAGGGAEVAPHFFEHDDADAARRLVDLPQPARGSAARSSRRPRTGRGGTRGRRWRWRRRGCGRPSRCAGPDRGRGSPVSSVCRRRAPRSEAVPQRLHPAVVASESS